MAKKKNKNECGQLDSVVRTVDGELEETVFPIL